METKLYIVGNGFDMHHDLKTSYWDYGQYLEQHNDDLYEMLLGYIGFPNTDKNLWSNFEANLANLEMDELLASGSNYLPDYSSDNFRDRDRYDFSTEMESHYKLLTEGLLSEFKDFILNVKYDIDFVAPKMIKLDRMAHFLTFNYTDTLERVYGVNKASIKYIHRSAHEADVDLVLGHDIDPSNFIKNQPEPPFGLSEKDLQRWTEEQGDLWDYSFDLGEQIIREYFQASFKPTANIINENEAYFDSLANVTEVQIMGHSLSEVDICYFERIAKSVNDDCTWKISFRDDGDDVKFTDTLMTLGIEREKINTYKLTDLLLTNEQLKLEL